MTAKACHDKKKVELRLLLFISYQMLLYQRVLPKQKERIKKYH